ncbi:MAG: RNA 2',3'-cyclic phosphodiesterase, partial [Bacillota bacterium]|nr:RNA 2',3'-cyclic phosphodiesterase [Bacillota bacterium]
DTVMKELCSKSKPFSLSIKDIGIFNGRESIRVLWLGLGGDVKELGLLHKQTDETLSTLRFIPEKRSFKPHVTIGQDIVFECGFDQIRDAIGQLHYNSITVSSLFLFKSEQIGNKRVYTKVSQYDLYKKHY